MRHSWVPAQAEESGSSDQEGATEHLRGAGAPGQRQGPAKADVHALHVLHAVQADRLHESQV